MPNPYTSLRQQIYLGDEAIMLAYREGQHTMSAIAKELGLSVARISRVIASQEAKGKTSYIDSACETDCNHAVEQAELPDIGKTKGT